MLIRLLWWATTRRPRKRNGYWLSHRWLRCLLPTRANEKSNLSMSGIPLPRRARKSFCHRAASPLARWPLRRQKEHRSSRIIDSFLILDAWGGVEAWLGLAVG